MVDESRQKNDLTAAQAEVLEFIKKTCESAGVPPSYREIQNHFGYKAVGTVQDHVRALIKKGKLERVKSGKSGRSSRGWVPVGYQRVGVVQVPIYGEIAAGLARESEQLELGSVAISENISATPSFALRVVGDSMIDIGIFEGDLLVVDRRARIKTGDIVVALVDGETTVKRYRKKEGEIYLVPENRKMKPLRIESQRLEIQGKVVGLQRKL